ncbi:MAG: alpha/beta fold hydrolase, partial [Candidatus Saccharimonadales bacterium]
IKRLIDTYPDERVTLVGESAGGAMAIVAMRIFEDTIENVVTLCGMNYGAGSVSPYLYKSNPAFQDVMIKADTILPTMTDAEKNQMFILYSSKDFTVRPSSSLIAGVMSHDLKIAGHMVAILTVLFFRFRLILDRK